MNKWTLLPASLILLSACGGGSKMPPEQPPTPLKGHAVDAIIRGGNIEVYGFANGQRGALLGSTVTGEDGSYSVDLTAESQPVLIELTGGQYTEEASGQTVSLKEGQILRALVHYDYRKSLQNVIVSPATNLAAGLAAWRHKQGLDNIENAITKAASEVTAIVGAPILTTKPLDITDPANVTAQPQAGHKYGFYLAAISNWTYRAAKASGVVDPHATGFTSIHLAQLMYNDVLVDGKLDGQGVREDSTTGLLSFGKTALDANVYRKAFAASMLQMAASDRNRTGIASAQLVGAASELATRTGIFGSQPPEPLDNQGPTISAAKENAPGTYQAGVLPFKVLVTDLVGVASIDFYVNAVAEEEGKCPLTLVGFVGSATDLSAPSFAINTKQWPDGEHKIGVCARDALGNESYTQIPFNFANGGPLLNLTSPALTNNLNYSIQGTYDDHGAGMISVTVGKETAAKLNEEAKTWTAEVVLVPGFNKVKVVAKDGLGQITETVFTVAVDRTQPRISVNTARGTVRYSDGQGKYYPSTAMLSQNINEVLYFEPSTVALGSGIDPRVTSDQDRQELDKRGVPYFQFYIDDPDTGGIFSKPDKLKASYSYVRGDEVFIKDQPMAVGASNFIPIATEILGPTWYQASKDTKHRILVNVQDEAGNLATQEFIFLAEVVIPPLPTAITQPASPLASTPFAQRASLSGATVPTTTYRVQNPYSFPLWIYLEAGDGHSFLQTWESKRRFHRYRRVVQEEWQAGAFNITYTVHPYGGDVNTYYYDCTATPTAVRSVSSVDIINFNDGKRPFSTRTVPAPVIDPYVNTATPAPGESATPWTAKTWSDVDPWTTNIRLTGTNLIAYVPNRRFQTGEHYTTGSGSCLGNLRAQMWINNTLQPENSLHSRIRTYYEYDPASPRVDDTRTETAGGPFSDTSFVVKDESGASVQQSEGWYKLLAGKAIVATQMVKLPAFEPKYSAEILDSEYISAEFRAYDKALTWNIDQNLTIYASLDTGSAPRGEKTGSATAVSQDKRAFVVAR